MRDVEVTPFDSNTNHRKNDADSENDCQRQCVHTDKHGPYENGVHENGFHENGIHEDGVHKSGLHESVVRENGANDKDQLGDEVVQTKQPVVYGQEIGTTTVTIVGKIITSTDKSGDTISEIPSSEVVSKTNVAVKTKKKKMISSKSTSTIKACTKPSSFKKASSCSNIKSVPPVLKKSPTKPVSTSISPTKKTTIKTRTTKVSVAKTTDSKSTSSTPITSRPILYKPASSKPTYTKRKPITTSNVLSTSSKSTSTAKPTLKTNLTSAKVISASKATPTSRVLGTVSTSKSNPIKTSFKSTVTEVKVSPSKPPILKTALVGRTACKSSTCKSITTKVTKSNSVCLCRMTCKPMVPKIAVPRPALKKTVQAPAIETVTLKMKAEKKNVVSTSKIITKNVGQLRTKKVANKNDEKLSIKTDTKKVASKTSKNVKVCESKALPEVLYGVKKSKPPVASKSDRPSCIKSTGKNSADAGKVKSASAGPSKSKGNTSPTKSSKKSSTKATRGRGHATRGHATKSDMPDTKTTSESDINRPLIIDGKLKLKDDIIMPDLIINLTIQEDTPNSTSPLSPQSDVSETNITNDNSTTPNVDTTSQGVTLVSIPPEVEIISNASQEAKYGAITNDKIKYEAITSECTDEDLPPAYTSSVKLCGKDKGSFEVTVMDVNISNNKSDTCDTDDVKDVHEVNDEIKNLKAATVVKDDIDSDTLDHTFDVVKDINEDNNQYEFALLSSKEIEGNFKVSQYYQDLGFYSDEMSDSKQENYNIANDNFQASQCSNEHEVKGDKISEQILCKNEDKGTAHENSEQFFYKNEAEMTADGTPEIFLRENEDEVTGDTISQQSYNYKGEVIADEIFQQSLFINQDEVTANEMSQQLLCKNKDAVIGDETSEQLFKYEMTANERYEQRYEQALYRNDEEVTANGISQQSLDRIDEEITTCEIFQQALCRNEDEVTADEISQQYLCKNKDEVTVDGIFQQSLCENENKVPAEEIFQQLLYKNEDEGNANEISQQYPCIKEDNVAANKIFQQTLLYKNEDEVKLMNVSEAKYLDANDIETPMSNISLYGTDDGQDVFDNLHLTEGLSQEMDNTNSSVNYAGEDVINDESQENVPVCSSSDFSQVMEANTYYIELLQSRTDDEMRDIPLTENEGVCNNQLENEIAEFTRDNVLDESVVDNAECCDNGNECNKQLTGDMSSTYREYDVEDFRRHQQQNLKNEKGFVEDIMVEDDSKGNEDKESSQCDFINCDVVNEDKIYIPTIQLQNDDGDDTQCVLTNDVERLVPRRSIGAFGR